MTTDAKTILQIIILLIFFLVIAIYAFIGSHELIFGVQIKNVNIKDGTKYSNNIVEVSGNARNATNLTLNGREISINQNGDFKEVIALLSGYNIVEIKAKDKFGEADEKNYKLIY